jgi:hypothetical protein
VVFGGRMIEAKQSVDDRIRELYKDHGRITPDIVIEDAKNPDSPLHDQFEWNVEAAAMEAWRDTARRLIRSVRIVIQTESKTFKTSGYRPHEFVRDPSAPSNHQGYARAADLRSDHERAVAALMYEIDRINGALARARSICEELGLDQEFHIVDDAVKAMRRKAAG